MGMRSLLAMSSDPKFEGITPAIVRAFHAARDAKLERRASNVVVARAFKFNSTTDYKAEAPEKHSSDDTVEFSQFRLFLVFFKRYLEASGLCTCALHAHPHSHTAHFPHTAHFRPHTTLLVMFDQVDTSDDRRVDQGEFEAALPLFEKWGVRIENAAQEFSKIDLDRGGRVLFDEFAACANHAQYSNRPFH
eukprot:6725684-Prymnesium_polylepis.1